VIDGYVITNDCGLTDDNARTVIDEQVFTNCRFGVNFDSRDDTPNHRKKTR